MFVIWGEQILTKNINSSSHNSFVLIWFLFPGIRPPLLLFCCLIVCLCANNLWVCYSQQKNHKMNKLIPTQALAKAHQLLLEIMPSGVCDLIIDLATGFKGICQQVTTIPLTIHSLGTLPNNQMVLIGGHARTLTIWDLDVAGVLRFVKVPQHQGTYGVFAIAMCPNGDMMTTTSRSFHVWNATVHNAPPLSYYIETFEADNITILENGLVAVASGFDREVNVRKLDSADPVCVLRGHTGFVNNVLALPGNRLASSSDDTTVRVWDVSDPTHPVCQHTLSGHTKPVGSLVALPNNMLASGSDDGTVRVWDLNGPDAPTTLHTFQSKAGSFEGNTGSTVAMVALPDGLFAMCSESTNIRVVDLSTPGGATCVHLLRGHKRHIHSLLCLPGGRLGSCSDDGELRVWN